MNNKNVAKAPKVTTTNTTASTAAQVILYFLFMIFNGYPNDIVNLLCQKLIDYFVAVRSNFRARKILKNCVLLRIIILILVQTYRVKF